MAGAVVFCSGDLMFTSRAQGLANSQGVQLITAASPSGAIEACRQQPVALLIIDLAQHAAQVDHMVREARACDPAPQEIIAYAPHVHQKLLTAGKEAGCDAVLSRGQFHAQLSDLLAGAR